MKLNEYQINAEKTAAYNKQVYADVVVVEDDVRWIDAIPLNFMYPVLGLAEEAGEVAGKVAKFVRKGGTNVLVLRDDVKKELGDVLWMVAAVASAFDLDLEEVAQFNLDKLADRVQRGVLIGEGDNR